MSISNTLPLFLTVSSLELELHLAEGGAFIHDPSAYTTVPLTVSLDSGQRTAVGEEYCR